MDLVDNWTTISFGFNVDNGPSETVLYLNMREVPPKEHSHIRGRELNCLLDSYKVHTCILGRKWSQHLHLEFGNPDRVNRLFR